jgi:hypothetical protein
MNDFPHTRPRRVDEHGRAYRGSQLQVQLYTNLHEVELQSALRKRLSGLDAELHWRAPVPRDRYREPSDGRFLRLVGLQDLQSKMAEFWPRGGPVWDGVGVLGETARDGLVLLEGKSYPAEAESSWRAKDPESRRKIRAAIEATRIALSDTGDADPWLNRYYQVANRLAWLRWLQAHEIPTSLVFLHFVDDVRHIPTSEKKWNEHVESLQDVLKVRFGAIPGVAVVPLPALPDKRTALPTSDQPKAR